LRFVCALSDTLWRSSLPDIVPDEDPQAEERMAFLLALRKRGIRNTRVLRALETVPRERFVEEAQQGFAFADQALPIACGQTISQPYVVAAMTEALEIGPHHKVLEIGTGSGYQAAILGRLAWEVFTIERYRTLAETARARLAALGLNNVTVIVGDGTKGDPEHAPFDRVIVTAATPEIPAALLDELAPDGILIAPIGPTGGVQQLTRVHKKPDGSLERRTLMAVRFVPLIPGQAAAL
jgi:protein-L-isoaspartate(D-aspartate) O-methyltransferase